jgi:hypothetical protein
MAAILMALALLLLVAADLYRHQRDRRFDPRPVLSHPRWPLLSLGAAAGGTALLRDPVLFLAACALCGACAALLCERFRLTAEGIECRGAVLAWSTLRLRRTALFVDVRTTRGQRLRLPRWMDGLGTLTRMAGGATLPGWKSPGASWS